MPAHHLTNFEIQKCYQSEPKFTGVRLRSYLTKIKDVTYITNLDSMNH